MPKNSKKNRHLFSEAFPPNKRGYRPKIYPSASSHTLLEGVKINSNEIIYKEIPKEYLEEVKNLHKEWFPVKYSDKFFESVFNPSNYWLFAIGAFYNYYNKETNENKQIILGVALCEWVPTNDEFINHMSRAAIREICRNIDTNEEVQSYIKCEDYRCIYIMTIGVIDEYRKMNIGTNILNAIIDYAMIDNLCVGVYLDVVYYNQTAINFYKKNNFKKIATIRNYYEIDGSNYDCNVFFRVFTRKEKDEFRERHRSKIQKIVEFLIITPFNFVIKIILFILLFQCFRSKIKSK